MSMNIREAIQARRSGVRVENVLAGMLKGQTAKMSVHDHYRRLKEAEGDGEISSTGLSGKIGAAISNAVEKEGPEVAAAAVQVALGKAPEAVQAALSALQQANGSAAPPPPADLGAAMAPEPEAPPAGGEADPFAGMDLGGAPEGGEAKETDVETGEGATDSADQGDLAGPKKESIRLKRKIKVLQDSLRRSLLLGEAMTRRARRYKVERDHFQNKLGLTEAESNLDNRCNEGYCFDVAKRACVQEHPLITKHVNEMMADPLDSSDPDKDQFEVPGGGSQHVGTTYRAALDGSDGGEDPIMGGAAKTGGVGSSRFTNGGGAGSGVGESLGEDFQTMDDDNDLVKLRFDPPEGAQAFAGQLATIGVTASLTAQGEVTIAGAAWNPKAMDLWLKQAGLAAEVTPPKKLGFMGSVLMGIGANIGSSLGALAGGAPGALAGALVGAPFGPVGMATGAVIGGIGGAIPGSLAGTGYGANMVRRWRGEESALGEQDVSALPNTPSPQTFASMNNTCPDGFSWSEEDARCLPSDQFPTNPNVTPMPMGNAGATGTPGEMAAESFNRRHFIDPAGARMNAENRDPLGRVISEVAVNPYHARQLNGAEMQDRRYNTHQRQIQARSLMVAEAMVRFGADQVRAKTLAERYVYEMMMLGPQQANHTASSMLREVPQQYGSDMMGAVHQSMMGAPTKAR